ncbi:stimulator of interferon genes protein homolog [Aethina tumida]|uniref:stimulator of interferon genes protein homolog n=1 Tax=Aethina tumida TaxID=116153 RepID=UPI00096B30DB|nr:stimulator of interferon genes protein homolog [Aethina tumida]
MTDFRSFYVYKKSNEKNQYYYPPSLPRIRTSTSKFIIFLTGVLCSLIPVFKSDNLYMSVFLYNLGLITIFILDYFHRVLLLIEEKNHLISRYNGRYWTLIHNFIYMPKVAVIILIFSVCFTSYVWGNNNNRTDFYDFVETNFLLHFPWYLLSLYLINKLLEVDTSIIHFSLWISNNHGIDYGAGMAYSYYYGYLNLILNKIGESDLNLKDAMQIYESKEEIKFELYKMFILIPKSMHCLVSLDESVDIECAKSLLEKTITRAGVRDRVYKNPVYKIKSDDGWKYLVAEYASPLKTFKEVVEHSRHERHSYIYRCLQSDIVQQFYITLNQILSDNRASELCDLIYYEDIDMDGKTLDISKILMTRIKQLQGSKKFK